MIEYPNYSDIQEVYIKPKQQFSSKNINKLTKVLGSKGKGVIDGLDIDFSSITFDVNITKGIILINDTLVDIKSNLVFNLQEELSKKYQYDEDGNELYSSLEDSLIANNVSRILLIIYYERDLNDPNKVPFFELIKEDEYIKEDNRQLMLYYWDLNVT